jgi:hypothetical protein
MRQLLAVLVPLLACGPAVADDNLSEIVQAGAGNNYVLHEQLGSGNRARIGQHGSGGEVLLRQDGNGNDANFDQFGRGHSIDAEQIGDGADAVVTQRGAGKSIIIRQSGPNPPPVFVNQ